MILATLSGTPRLLQHREKVKARKGTSDTAVHGKQSVKQLLGQNQGATNVEIDKDGIRGFERLARKYGVDFAVRKDILGIDRHKRVEEKKQQKKEQR